MTLTGWFKMKEKSSPLCSSHFSQWKERYNEEQRPSVASNHSVPMVSLADIPCNPENCSWALLFFSFWVNPDGFDGWLSFHCSFILCGFGELTQWELPKSVALEKRRHSANFVYGWCSMFQQPKHLGSSCCWWDTLTLHWWDIPVHFALTKWLSFNSKFRWQHGEPG